MILFAALSCKQEGPTGLVKSEFYTDSIYSEALGEHRKHNVYLPKGYDSSKQYPIIYATDGDLSIEYSTM